MTKTRLAIAALVIAGLAGSPFAAAKTYKHGKHHTSTSTTTTGANMKSSGGTSGGMTGKTSSQDGTGTTMNKDNSTPQTGK